jgi:hypothetical protein
LLAILAAERSVSLPIMGRMSSLRVTIPPDEENLTIEVAGRMHPASSDYWDGNWLTSPIHVDIGCFSGQIPASLRLDELRRFREQLETFYETLRGEARLESLEHWISLVFKADELGHVRVTGSVRDEPGMGSTLSFELLFDQTYLPAVLHQLQQIESAYPVVGR